MDNQYNYYDPNKEDKNNIFDEQPQGMNGGQPGMNGQPPKKHHKCPRWAKLAGSAVAFGVIASCTFMGVNAVAGKYFGTNTTQQTSNSKATTSKNSDSSSTLKLSQSSSTVTSDVSDIVNSAMPSVVAITNMSVQEVQSYFGGTQQQESTSCGSGIIIGKNDSELLIVTNNHVVEGAETLTVSFANETSVEASIKGTDSSKDLAVVAVPLDSIDDDTMNAISIITLGDSDQLQVGEPVIAIGNALGYGQSVTTGIVSALDRNLDMEGFDSKLIQTDAAINPGNSGGALLNANGELIGINTAKVNANAVEGMGYAIPISDATSVIENLMNRETRTKVDESEQGFLGIEGYDVTSEKAEMYSIPTGVFVRSVEDGSAADKAGITAECIITKFDGITIDSMSTLQSQMQYFKAGDKVEVVIEVPNKSGTKYEEKTVTVTLGERSK
ncbi:S1C family serine protease [Dorea ammoniilytica]|uniref:Trypsin-like peptidase domain-containing protein n=1 Tax=Dorea ammoniilytica TaxID=2981788 RepID=A0ABT2S6J7_9FIRM|nr:trypsin-like peptidase domain-containing protein [Dorea ammoniilytica]MCU6700216.1 trypsin-like peptidase domain-containing protein [Dorea ammoniilytica]SCH74836.1 Periplasmic pH-dependent serine endoprotease DegQ precursor [uncultured Eubacterium sp.]